jgi:hypothetical protein
MSRNTGRRAVTRLRPLLVAFTAGGIYGSWTAFVHIHNGLGARTAMCAGWTQVGLSIFATLFFALLMERLFRVPSNPRHGFWLAVFGSSALGTVWLVVGHQLAGTPHILESITPSLIVGAAFDFTYAGRLLALARRRVDSIAVRAVSRDVPPAQCAGGVARQTTGSGEYISRTHISRTHTPRRRTVGRERFPDLAKVRKLGHAGKRYRADAASTVLSLNTIERQRITAMGHCLRWPLDSRRRRA